jgi:prephenate dehydratase
VRIAIQGEIGSFSHAAVFEMFPDARDSRTIEIVPCAVSTDVFDALVTAESVDAAVIPIENSLAGSILEHYDLLLHNPVRILAEHRQRIRHNLIGIHGARIEHLERVFSHPIALAQCRDFLRHHSHIQVVPFYDTAGSVKAVVEQHNRRLAAIASIQAAAFYGGQILAENIEDNDQNYTRFQLLRRVADAAPYPDANRMSLAFALENRPGSLVSALQKLAAHDLNLTKIESRPVPGKPWEYVFYVDLTFPTADVADTAIAALHTIAPMVKELGRYRAT